MWSLKIDGRIPSFNEIGDYCSSSSSSYRSYYQHDLILQQPHLISSCSYPNDAGSHKKTKWKAKTSFIWKEEAKLATNWYYVLQYIVLTVQWWWDGTPQYVPPDLYMLCACDTMWDGSQTFAPQGTFCHIRHNTLCTSYKNISEFKTRPKYLAAFLFCYCVTQQDFWLILADQYYLDKMNKISSKYPFYFLIK